MTLLAQATLMIARVDGWTLLSTAGHFVAAEDPELLRSIKRCFGHPNLNALVAAAEIFELLKEANACCIESAPVLSRSFDRSPDVFLYRRTCAATATAQVYSGQAF